MSDLYFIYGMTYLTIWPANIGERKLVFRMNKYEIEVNIIKREIIFFVFGKRFLIFDFKYIFIVFLKTDKLQITLKQREQQ